jgi:small-conductance mechanosensitive channel/CRP-like cAMP-binding protein
LGDFADVDISWGAVALAIATVFASLFARRLLPPDRQDRGRLPIILLLSSVVLRALAVPIEVAEYHDLVTGLKLAAAITLAAGMTGIIGKLLFDIVLARFFQFPTILRDILLFIAFVIALMTILQQSGANLVSLVTTSAVLTAVIGLALQQPIANMFAGLSLQIDDRIGRVEKISFRATTIVTRDDDSVTFPNAYFMTHAVLNYSRPSEKHRMWCEVGIAYKHPPNEVKRVLEGALRDCEGVLPHPAPRVILRGFGDSGVQYAVLYWINDFGRDVLIESDVRTRIWYAAQRANLEIPYPVRTVHMHQITAESEKAGEERDHDGRRSALAQVELFGKLEDAELDLIARGMKRRMFARGEVIVRQGDPGDSLFLIADGEVGVVLSVDGAERQVATLTGGDILGELSLVTGEARTATCIAVQDAHVHEIDHALFRKLLEGKPTLAEGFSAILSDRQHALEAERDGLSAEAAMHRRDETKKRLLGRIRSYFRLV